MRILIVEDDGDLRESLGAVLTDEGFEAFMVRHGREALEWLATNPAPGAILLDSMLPILSGPELNEALRTSPTLAKIPVVILSALDLDQQRKELPGARAYLRKPVAVEELVETLRSLA